MSVDRPRRVSVALLVAALLAAGCWPSDEKEGKPGSGEPQNGQVFSTAMVSDPKTFNPILASDPASSAAVGALFDSLVRLDPVTERMEPFLATRWEANAEGTLYRFFLRNNVRWHDGEPLTAQDVEFTFEAIYDERVPNVLRQFLSVDGQPLHVEAVGDYVVEVRVPRPFAPLIYSLAVPIVPRHALAEALQEGTFARQWGTDTPPEQVIGSGSYRMLRYEPGKRIDFVRNPEYWMKDENHARLPYQEKRTIFIVPDAEAAYAKFLARETDFYQPRLGEVAELRAKASALGVRVEAVGPDPGILYLAFNRNPLRDQSDGPARVRLDWFRDRSFLGAIARGIDRRSIIEGAMHGLGEPAESYPSSESAAFRDASPRSYPFDLDEARRLLREGGYVDRDGDGTIEDAKGNPVVFSLSTNAGNPLRERICAILAETWTKLGMKVEVRPLDFAVLVEKLDTTFDWDAVLMGLTGSLEPDAASNVLRSSGKLHVWHPNQASPATPWEAEIDRLLDAASRELVLERRVGLYRRIQEILHEELPIIPTVSEMRFVAFSDKLQNFRATPWGIDRPERLWFSGNGTAGNP